MCTSWQLAQRSFASFMSTHAALPCALAWTGFAIVPNIWFAGENFDWNETRPPEPASGAPFQPWQVTQVMPSWPRGEPWIGSTADGTTAAPVGAWQFTHMFAGSGFEAAASGPRATWFVCATTGAWIAARACIEPLHCEKIAPWQRAQDPAERGSELTGTSFAGSPPVDSGAASGSVPLVAGSVAEPPPGRRIEGASSQAVVVEAAAAIARAATNVREERRAKNPEETIDTLLSSRSVSPRCPSGSFDPPTAPRKYASSPPWTTDLRSPSTESSMIVIFQCHPTG